MVALPSDATTFDALSAANIALVTQDAGYGPAVCKIDAVGCPATDCFCDAKHFWAYYHLNPSANRWTTASEGVGGYVPADGAVEGFAWSGFDAGFNPNVQPPVYSFPQVAAHAAPQHALLPADYSNAPCCPAMPPFCSWLSVWSWSGMVRAPKGTAMRNP